MIASVLADLASGKNLSEARARSVFEALLGGKLNRSQAKALLLLLAEKGESIAEVAGCVAAIRKLEPPRDLGIPLLMDTCGTGGDGSHSFNVSTVAAFIIAGAGGRVAKHGNRALSSRSGSSDLMEAFGVCLEAPKKRMLESLRRFGIGYFHAPYYHPVFSKIQPLRRELGVRTIFNLLGPLLNPFRLRYQLVGVADAGFLNLYGAILKRMRMKQVYICHSRQGMDEITPGGVTDVTVVRQGKTSKKTLTPKRLGFRPARLSDYRGGNAEANKKKALKLLSNRLEGPLRDIVLLNAAAGLNVCGLAGSLEQGVTLAEIALRSGRAMESLQGLIRTSQKS